jgi:hypothetical protein
MQDFVVIPAVSTEHSSLVVPCRFDRVIAKPRHMAQSCYSDFTDLLLGASGSMFQIPSIPGSPTGQTVFTICPGSILQMDQPFSSSPNIRNILSGSLFQCGEDGSGTDCILEPLGTGANFPFFDVAVSGVRFVGLHFRNSQNGAMRLSDPSGSATFERCTFSDNGGTGTASAVIVSYRTSATFINCGFERNAGRRVIYSGGSVTMDTCIFQDNPSMSSVYIRSQTEVGLDPARLTLSNSCFINNGGDDIILIEPGSIINDSTSGNNYGEGNTPTNCDGFFFQEDASCVAFNANICEATLTIAPTTLAPTTPVPSYAPSFAPSISPSRFPSVAPTIMPTVLSSDAPSVSPSAVPTATTTNMPSDLPITTGMPTTSRPTVMVTPEPTSGSAATSIGVHTIGLSLLGSMIALTFVL